MRRGGLDAPGTRKCPDSREDVSESNAGTVLPARVAIEEPRRRRLEDVEEPEEDETGDGRERRARKEEHGDEIARDLVDDDVSGVGYAEVAACAVGGGDPGERHGHRREDIDRPGGVGESPPERDGGEGPGGAGGDGEVACAEERRPGEGELRRRAAVAGKAARLADDDRSRHGAAGLRGRGLGGRGLAGG